MPPTADIRLHRSERRYGPLATIRTAANLGRFGGANLGMKHIDQQDHDAYQQTAEDP
jgi:hypothetical protein